MSQEQIVIHFSGPSRPFEITVDAVARVSYIRIRANAVYRTIEHETPGVYLDVDAEGRLVGIESYIPINVSGIKDAAAEYLRGDDEALEAVERAEKLIAAA